MDAFRSITLLNGSLNALKDCSPYVFCVKFAPFRHWMACYGAAAADSTDMPSFYIENDSLGIRRANIDANEVHNDAPSSTHTHRVKMREVPPRTLLDVIYIGVLVLLTCFRAKYAVRHPH